MINDKMTSLRIGTREEWLGRTPSCSSARRNYGLGDGLLTRSSTGPRGPRRRRPAHELAAPPRRIRERVNQSPSPELA